MTNPIFKRGLSWAGSFKTLAGGCLTVVIAGCGASTSPGGASPGDFAVGRRIFLTKCVTCHTRRRIENYSREEWPEILDDMSHRAKLNAMEKAQLRAYVLASRS